MKGLFSELGLVAHTCHPSTHHTGVGGLQVRGQPRLHDEPLPQKGVGWGGSTVQMSVQTGPGRVHQSHSQKLNLNLLLGLCTDISLEMLYRARCFRDQPLGTAEREPAGINFQP